jgi:hypothetical protein
MTQVPHVSIPKIDANNVLQLKYEFNIILQVEIIGIQRLLLQRTF